MPFQAVDQTRINKIRAIFDEGWSTSSSIGVTSEHSDELTRCANDVVYFANTYLQTYDPRIPGKSVPFALWPRQVEFLKWLTWLKQEAIGQYPVQLTALCEKSRDVGVSFLCGAEALHGFLFSPGDSIGFGSRKLEYVDNLGDLKSIFEKIRFMMRHLPVWMLPKGWKWGKHDTFCKFVNPVTGATITGEGGDGIGRGGRTSRYYVDESAFIERPHLLDAALVANCGLRIDVSTPNGPGNPFAVKRYSLPVERVFTLHWRDDPRKDEGWATKTKAEKGAAVFAAEYDIDYSASLEGICIPGAWVRAAVNLQLPRSNRFTAGLDIGEEGDDLSVFIARSGPVVERPVSWSKTLTTDTAWRAYDEGKKHHIRELCYDAVGVGAGAKSTFKVAERDRPTPLPFDTRAINVGSSPTDNVWLDGQTSKEKFANLKAELWWSVRQRFERTYEYVTNKVDHPLDTLISIPDHPQLIMELSLPTYAYTNGGKIVIEGKKELRARGIKSPDYAEALILSEVSHVVKLKQFWMR